ncbi:histidine kinase N-terminal domain-containing protein [Clostridium sp. PL3]|uniref:histidine kinase n=1 Tax=Clostridium thailandense TaxID=2794346 RepID=A0A949WPJ6_9CLOT|nr:histidine kinase N-terminal domain-containing protein [Clostridium thailandense]MBV7271310.1 histidine kinase N-terminal domain-containing protein [Clostridium thailandense]
MLKKLCKTYTDLCDEDINKLEQLEKFLPTIADLIMADVFIDCLTRDTNVAVVVSEAKPLNLQSMYKQPVVGQLALRENEPAVLRTLQIGMKTRDLKAITQENKLVKQNVLPIKNDFNKVIAVLIMEQDVTVDVNHHNNMEILSETAEKLAQTLLNLRDGEKENSITYYLDDAMLIFGENGIATYANPVAEMLYKKLGYIDEIVGMKFENLVLDGTNFLKVIQGNGAGVGEIEIGKLSLQVKYAVTRSRENTVGVIMLIKDITDVKEKEKELILKCVAIREIHHRVKNNLQTIASLLRLQSRRIENEQAKKLFQESICRILSIAVTHEVLARNGVDDVDIKTILCRIEKSTVSYCIEANKNIMVEILGDSFMVNSDKATSIALVVNELLQNSLQHGFCNQNDGHIEVIIQKGIMYSNISVIDNGQGFDVEKIGKESLGLNIVKGIVKDKLGGTTKIESSYQGTKIVFDFEN